MTPATEAELCAAIRAAAGPLHVFGGGTRHAFGHNAGEPLSAAGLHGLRLYEPGALTLVAGAGTPVAEIEAALAAEGQRLPFEPMDHRALLGTKGTPTIGGVVAANVSGPRRIQTGAARDHLLGVRFVDGTGTAAKAGGRVMKNVTGYDLGKLMAGSFGTVGVITEVSLKVLPRTETAATLLIEGLADETAIRALAAALASPFEVTGASHRPAGPDGPAVTMIRIEGFADSVAYRAGRLQERLRAYGEIAVESDPDATADRWRRVRDVAAFAGRRGDVWRISVKPTDAARAAAALPEAELLYDWGGGRVWTLVPEGTDIRPRLAGIAGHARLIRAAPETFAAIPAFPPETPTVAALAAGLRKKFDPRGILNPGLMAPADPAPDAIRGLERQAR